MDWEKLRSFGFLTDDVLSKNDFFYIQLKKDASIPGQKSFTSPLDGSGNQVQSN
jgi:hypothetical protein